MPVPAVPAEAPGALPVVGHARQLLWQRLALLEELRRHGDVVAVRIGPVRLFVVNDPALAREMLGRRASEFGTSDQYRLMAQITGNGLLLSEGAFHRRQRRLILPAFNHAKVRGYADTMSRLAESWADGLSEGRRLSADEEFAALATEIVVRCLFSQGIDRRSTAEVVDGLPHLMRWVGSRGLDPTGLLARLPTPVNRRFRASIRTLNGIVRGAVAERRSSSGGGEEDLLSVLLQTRDAETGEPMADRQIHDEVMTLLTAGTETVSRTLAWTVHLLARHPEVRRRLHGEVDEVLAGRAASFEDLPRLPYTRQVLTETLRLYPSGYLLSRAAVADTVLGGHLLPAGSTVMFSPYAVHRDPALFAEPGRFDPGRWSPERADDVTPEAYLPFGLGPHGCIGEGFAWTEMTIVLATLAARWELCPASAKAVRPVPTFSLSCGRMLMTTRRRSPLSAVVQRTTSAPIRPAAPTN
ncbi:cytochrome P450 [Kitasatospora atroaurantiaca]|uniref:Cytochrome P450 n=1 Tax=Kitasatospora atroaurantiaca TaxID=285545 RepID=A0A561F1L4_9ACTN|nr:cytochrome P450 [Kitasatospora atroaurantiaca]TWE21760.1 cytochrome P450 [Kitasatospora atroaurantiaca]